MTEEMPMGAVWPALRERLEFLTRPFPYDAIALAEANRDEVAPHLVAVLEVLAADPYASEGEGMLHLYAMHLLGWWRDVRALRPLLALGGMRDHDRLDELFGDDLFESYPRCLAAVCDRDVDALKTLCEDTGASVWARSAALDSLKACVVEGDTDRDAVIAYLGDLGGREADALRAAGVRGTGPFSLLDPIVGLATDLGAAGMLPAIRAWFAEDLLDTSYADLAFVEANIHAPFESSVGSMRQRRYGYVADPATEMAWWAAFTEGEDGEVDDTTWDEFIEQPYVREAPKIGRNDPCPCGSGKKYKKCHGAA